MCKIRSQIIICCSVVVTGCASIDFDGAGEGEGKAKGLTYFEPHPHLLVSTGADCVQTVQVVMIPGESKVMKFNTGFGASTLTATLADGMITSVGQTSDTKASELLTAAATVATAVAIREETTPEFVIWLPAYM